MIAYYTYLITPFLAWLIAGTLKFIINSLKAKKLAFGLIGYGGMPSNHSAIVSSTTALIGLKEGMHTPIFGLAITFLFIVILDAGSLRREVGKHATRLNQLDSSQLLRERMGHTPLEILGGVIVGSLVAFFVHLIL